MNRKELACAAAGAVLGAAGCSPAVRSLAVPAVDADERSNATLARAANENMPHLEQAVITLISGTTRDASSAVFRMLPKSGWSIGSSDPRLAVSIDLGHVATIVAPETEKVMFVALVTISHTGGTQFTVRCHVEERCTN